jgi:hypothetical protein
MRREGKSAWLHHDLGSVTGDDKNAAALIVGAGIDYGRVTSRMIATRPIKSDNDEAIRPHGGKVIARIGFAEGTECGPCASARWACPHALAVIASATQKQQRQYNVPPRAIRQRFVIM